MLKSEKNEISRFQVNVDHDYAGYLFNFRLNFRFTSNFQFNFYRAAPTFSEPQLGRGSRRSPRPTRSLLLLRVADTLTYMESTRGKMYA